MNDLLKPSLTKTSAPPLYSTRANFFVAFFGGPLAITLFSALNARRLRRLGQDLPFYLLGLALYLGLFAWLALNYPTGPDLLEGALEARRNPFIRYGGRFLGLVLWGGYYLRHRPFHKASDLLGLDSPNPWGPALACFGLALAVEIPLITLLLQLRGLP